MPQSERFYRAARFPDESSSESPYLQLQELVYESDSDLSVYRFQLQTIWHIAVLGEQPDTQLESQFEEILNAGQTTELDSDTLDFFFRNREESVIQGGGWTETHYSPGLRVVIPKFGLGQVVMTRGVQAALEQHPDGRGLEELENIILNRHAQGDWGDLDQHDIDANERALQSGGRLFSVYYLTDGTERGTKIYVITEWDRSITTALLPEEY